MERKKDEINFHKHTVFNSDPFAVDPLPKPHYYPSPERRTQARQKYIVGKAPLEKKTEQEYKNDRLSPMDELFLKGSNFYQSQNTEHLSELADDINFDESWPTSEKPSSLSISGFEEDGQLDIESYQETLDKFTDLKKTLKFVDKENQQSSKQQRLRKPGSASQTVGIGRTKKTENSVCSKIPIKNSKTGKKMNEDVSKKDSHSSENGQGSVLQRYVERFRNSAPMSREQRDKSKAGSSKDFWWMSNDNEVVQPSVSPKPREIHTNGTIPLTEENLDKYSSFEGLKKFGKRDWNDSPDHKKTVRLQEKAEKLLERSSSSVVSTDPAVSTEGLGSNMSDMSSIEEYSYRPPFARYTDNENFAKYPRDGVGLASRPQTSGYPNRPEDDPLHQWRIRRRIEQAKEAGPANVGSFGFLTKTEQQRKIDAKLEEFKQRLAGKEPPSQHERTQLTREEKPVNPNKSECSVPQSSTGRVQFTPAPTYSQKDDCDIKTKTQSPEIASPTLHRHKVKSHDVQHIDPHLHLMCDLLPCPHRQEYRDQYNSDDDCSDNTKETNNIQYLQAEKPDVEKRDSDRPSENDDINYDSSRTNSRKEFKNTTTDNDVIKRSNNISDKKKKVVIQDKRVDKQSATGISQDDHMEDNERQGFQHKHRGDNEGQRFENYPDETVDRHHGSKKGGRNNNVIKPTNSSSPKIGRKTVESTIGQVVKDLFSTTTSTVLSSVDSLPPSMSVERLDLKRAARVEQKQLTEEQYESDEEYQDDQLLQMLRKQRAFFELQLQQIDEKLKSVEDR